MATVKPTRVENNNRTTLVTWDTMTTSDTGDVVDVSDLTERTVHVYSAGAGTAQLQGSNDGTNWVSIGAALAANTLTLLSVNPKYLKISVVAAASVKVMINGKRF